MTDRVVLKHDVSLDIAGAGPGPADDAVLYVTAAKVRAARDRRHAVFAHADTIFHEPAWDLLLDLFIAERDGRAPAFETLCDRARLRPSTALRWITTLERLDLVEARADSITGMPLLRLSPAGRDAMTCYLRGE